MKYSSNIIEVAVKSAVVALLSAAVLGVIAYFEWGLGLLDGIP